jgi:hypothetical protein
VLHDDWEAARDLRERLVERLGAGRPWTRERIPPTARARVHPERGDGLESPVVFLAGAQRIFEREGSPELDAESRDQPATKPRQVPHGRHARRIAPVVTMPDRCPERGGEVLCLKTGA